MNLHFLKPRSNNNSAIKKCVNCGAPLRGHVCEYCGTIYEQSDIDKVKSDLEAKILQKEFERTQQKQMCYLLRIL